MKAKFSGLVAILVMVCAISAMACGSASATTIAGSLHFGTFGSTNFYDPAASGFVPSGFGNSVSPVAVPVGAGVEFGYNDGSNFDTADFTSTSLSIQDVTSVGGSNSWTQTFTASTPGFFSGLTAGSDSFPGGVTFSVVGDTLTLTYAGALFSDTEHANFTFGVAATPLPASWTMMLGALVFLGFIAYRRGKRSNGSLAMASA